LVELGSVVVYLLSLVIIGLMTTQLN